MSMLQVVRPITTQTVTVGASSASTTNTVNNDVVRLLATVETHVSFGAATATATTSDMQLAAGVPEYFTIATGSKVACIQASSGGSLYVTECSR